MWGLGLRENWFPDVPLELPREERLREEFGAHGLQASVRSPSP